MKKALLITALLLSNPASAITDKQEVYCQVMMSMAEDIMKLRQIDEPIEAVRGVMGDIMSGGITDAYEYPLGESEESKKLMIEFFSNRYGVACYENADD